MGEEDITKPKKLIVSLVPSCCAGHLHSFQIYREKGMFANLFLHNLHTCTPTCGLVLEYSLLRSTDQPLHGDRSGAVVEHRSDDQKVVGLIPDRVATSFLHIVRNIPDIVETNVETQTKELKTQKRVTPAYKTNKQT